MPTPDLADGSTGTQILIKVTELTVKVENVLTTLPDHESRIRTLERFRWTILGMWLLLTVASGIAGYFIHGKG